MLRSVIAQRQIIAERRSVDIGTSVASSTVCRIGTRVYQRRRELTIGSFEKHGELWPTATSELHRRRPVMAAAVLAPFAVHRALQPDHRRLQELD